MSATSRATGQPDVIVVGAGFGGLAAALRCAAAGRSVLVLERHPDVGGKAGTFRWEGVTMDTGPSVLTMPYVFEELFALAGTRLQERVRLRTHDPAFRYQWPDGTRFEVYATPERTRESVRSTFGEDAAAQWDAFLAYAERIWQAAAPNFIFSPAPSAQHLLRLGWSVMRSVSAIDPLRSMQGGIAAHVRDPYLRDVLLRYATYNGSDPRVAPATLNCIAYVELVEGAYGVEGGIAALAQALRERAAELGVTFATGEGVQGLVVEEGRVVGVRTAERVLRSAAVIANCDVGELREALLPTAQRAALGKPQTPSTSGWTGLVRTRRNDDMAAHSVYFSHPYLREFEDLFDAKRAPEQPTVYLCHQRLAHGRTAWPDDDALFIMANAPALVEGGDPAAAAAEAAALGRRALARAQEVGWIAEDATLLWERGPTELAEAFPGSRGALYGDASNDRSAAFRRPANRVQGLPGLYLASGSAHPGGGVPLCAQSGRCAAEAWLQDHAS